MIKYICSLKCANQLKKQQEDSIKVSQFMFGMEELMFLSMKSEDHDILISGLKVKNLASLALRSAKHSKQSSCRATAQHSMQYSVCQLWF